MSSEGGGAGNNWAFGYSEGVRVKDELLEIIDRESEACDSLEVHFWSCLFYLKPLHTFHMLFKYLIKIRDLHWCIQLRVVLVLDLALLC